MTSPYNTQNIITNLLFEIFSVKKTRLILTALTLSFTSTSIAAWNNSTDTTPDYVDSVQKWGAWGLDIEPAAGGLQQSSSQGLKARDSKVSLRTNSISALAPPSPSPVIFSPPTSPIVPPVVPVITPLPPVTPPIGGPADGLF